MEKNTFICLPNVNGNFPSRELCQTVAKALSIKKQEKYAQKAELAAEYAKFSAQQEKQKELDELEAERVKQKELEDRQKKEIIEFPLEQARYEKEIAEQHAERLKQEEELKNPDIAARIAVIKSQKSIIDNKNALIWAFNEAIDDGTTFDGNSPTTSITQMKEIINYLLLIKCFDKHITEQIINKFMEILETIKIIIPESISKNNDYILCGWNEHAILLFWEEQSDKTYDFGMINCGEGADIQGANSILCNGLIIFKNIKEENINNFLKTYKKYDEMTRKHSSMFLKNKGYLIFYFILFHKLLEIKNNVDFINLKSSGKIFTYPIELQLIGSCTFTNLINLIYYIYINKNGYNLQSYEKYMSWYNTAKLEIKIKLFNEIIHSPNKDFINFYQYILDTTSSVYITPDETYQNSLFTNLTIVGKYITYTHITLPDTIKNINRHQINLDIFLQMQKKHGEIYVDKSDKLELENALWKLYLEYNLEPFIVYLTKQKEINETKRADETEPIDETYYNMTLDYLVYFYFFCKSFDNGNRLLIPLLILYKLIQDQDIRISKIFTKTVLDRFYNTHIIFCNLQIIGDSKHHDVLINTVIYLILIKNYIRPDEKYYRHYPAIHSIGTRNILFYNYILFKHIPIINYYYYEIVTKLVEDLNTNIDLLPDITDRTGTEMECIINNKEISYNIFMKDKGEKILVKYLTKNIIVSKNNQFKFTCINSINFLLWNILINYIDEELPGFTITRTPPQKTIQFETYGHYNKKLYDIYKFKNIIIDDTRHFFGYPGGFSATNHKIELFKETIKIKLEDENIQGKPTFDILKHYIIYFYLCEFSSNTLQKTDPIFIKYNGYITSYFDEYYKLDYFKTLVYTYILKYDLSYNIPETQTIELTDDCLISNIEKQYFVLSQYKYTIGKNGVFNSVLSFYTIRYNEKYTLFFYRKNEATDVSINIIKTLLTLYNFIYMALNFYYSKTDKKIIGINKNDSAIRIEYNEDDIFDMDYIENDTKYKIVSYTELRDKYLQFYNLMTYNDISIFIYTNEQKDTYFLRTLNYDFVFTMHHGNIFYTINGVEYQVNFYNDIDIYNNNGILKLSNENSHKLLCIYNYNHIQNQPQLNGIMTFINPQFFSGKKSFSHDTDIPIEFKQHYYKIINKYNDKYIFTNIDEVFALLINCLNYNSPYLILKNIEQIKNILNNNKSENYERLLNTLFARFDNLYIISILLLFYKDKKLNEYYYSHANKLYTKYNILLELEYEPNFATKEFNYTNLTINLDYTLNPEQTENYLYYQFNSYISTLPYTFHNDIIFTEELYGELEILKKSNLQYIYSYYTPQKERLVHSHQINIILSDISTDTPTDSPLKIKYVNHVRVENKIYEKTFKSLLTMYISDLDNSIFDNNIKKATELFNYLILPNKNKLYPIQELIMGSGKTTSITPYICILLLAHFLKGVIINYDYKNEIYIVMPEFLINSSFEILMKYVFPLFNNIEILIYPVEPNYKNSFQVYLISDTNYKIMFLRKQINTDTKYMIYDEIDMMANPLTCELNIPYTLTQFTSFDDLYILSKILYDEIFNNKLFWNGIPDASTITENNGKHSYFFIMNPVITEYINTFYDTIIKKHFIQEKLIKLEQLIKYIKDNVLLFILTKQFNFDYGMPETYSLNLSTKYKFKAIPYSAVDNPLMGSEFSDFILTYILTFFCYKIVDSKYRKIDKEHIITYYETLKNYEMVFECLAEKPPTIAIYIAFSNHYKNKYKEQCKLDDDEFEIIIKQILKKNSDYHSQCQNISFNDLLLSKNVKNFVCFTGTAYIQVPVDDKHIKFDNTDFIHFSLIENKKISEVIIDIIKNTNIVKNLYNNDNILIDDIFKCLTEYDVLIDIGGIFISYNINDFITKYKELESRKNYFVYFDNGRKIYNLDTDKYVDKNVVDDNNTFYYFSNKNITGVDAKDIMSKTARGLIIITNNTNIRDFSQGIFRMRHILKGQSCDIIFNNKFTDIILQVGGCKNFKEITKEGMTNEDIRQHIIKNLEKQQNIIDSQKQKVLIKQNIFALKKLATNNNGLVLYLDPMTPQYIKSVKRFNKYVGQYTPTPKFDIESFNIINKINAPVKDDLATKPLLKSLVDKYFTFEIDIIGSKQNMVQEQTQEQKQEKEKSENSSLALVVNKSIIKHPSLDNKGIIYFDFSSEKIISSEKISRDQILVAYICDIIYLDILLIYDNTNNNLVIIDTNGVTNFLIYNEDITKYTFIPFYNKTIYGKQISNDLVKYLFQLALTTLNTIINMITSMDPDATNNYLKLIQHLNNIKYNPEYTFKKTIPTIPTLTFLELRTPKPYKNFDRIMISNVYSKLYIKYIKYKTKYLNLKNIKVYPIYYSDNIIEDSDSFYKKYTKYKTKYLQFKNKI